jgi:hypothetical protein
MARLPTGERVVSAPVALQVAPRLTLRAPAQATVGRRFAVRGAMSPARTTRATLVIAAEGSDARIRVPVRVKAGRFATTVRLRRPALHRIRVAFAGDAGNAAGRSADVLVRAIG